MLKDTQAGQGQEHRLLGLPVQACCPTPPCLRLGELEMRSRHCLAQHFLPGTRFGGLRSLEAVAIWVCLGPSA